MSTRYARGRQYKRRRSRYRLDFKRLLRFVIILAFCAMGILYLHRNWVVSSVASTFPHGIKVDGVELGGYTYQDARTLLSERKDNWLTKQIQLRYGDKNWTFTLKDIVSGDIDVEDALARAWEYGHTGNLFQKYDQIAALADQPVAIGLSFAKDDTRLDELLREIKETIDVAPVDAVLTVDQAGVSISESSPGWAIDSEALKAQLLDAVRNGQYEEIVLEPQRIEPATAKSDLEGTVVKRGIGGKTRIAGETTSNRTKNITLAASKLNGLIVQNGVTVSFNDHIGQRTRAAGFLEAPEFVDNETKDGVGGGICQVSTTLYGALLRAGVDIVQRHPHSSLVGYVDPSHDAAVFWGKKDLVFTNNTGAPIYIFAYRVKRDLYVEIYGAPMDVFIEINTHEIENIPMKSINVKDTKEQYTSVEDPIKDFVDDGKDGAVTRAILSYYDLQTHALIDTKPLEIDHYKARDYYIYYHPSY